MTSQKFVLNSSYGLRTKEITRLVQCALGFQCEIFLEANQRRVDLKSIMGVASLGIANQAQIQIFADGADEKQAIKELEKELLELQFTNTI